MTDTDLITAEGSLDQSAPPSGGSLGAMVLPELRTLVAASLQVA